MPCSFFLARRSLRRVFIRVTAKTRIRAGSSTHSQGPKRSAILERLRVVVRMCWSFPKPTLERTANLTQSSVSARATERAANFNAGPGALPLAVLERIREELTDYRGTGMSVMEMSHRSNEFEEIIAHAEKKLRQLMGVSDDYGVIFVQGGGSAQFTMAPMNLCVATKPIDVLHTGMWTGKAISELKKGIPYRLAASTEAEKFTRLPRPEEIQLSADASYVYMCTNNTIEGSQWASMPETGSTPLVADMSSDI